ncbi:MAG TPA: hypothetical protein VF681_01455 [Abditibacteriaceae bacterium]|jgi:hypothetical protein
MKPLLIRIPGVAVQLRLQDDDINEAFGFDSVIALIKRKNFRMPEGDNPVSRNDIDVVRAIIAYGPAILEWLDTQEQKPAPPVIEPLSAKADPRELRPIGPAYPRRSTVPCDNCGDQQVVQLNTTDLRCESCGWRTRIDK